MHRLLHNRNFAALWVGQAISSIGDYFTLLAVPIFVNRLTGSVMLVGLSFLSVALPALVLGPVAGVFVDRFDRRKVMIVSDVLRGLLTLCLLSVRDAGQVWVVYLVGFLVSCSAQFFYPARGAALPLIVKDPDDWLAANTAMRIIQTVGMLAGPALAGVSIGLWGEQVAFIADGSSFLLSALAVSLMAVPYTRGYAALEVRRNESIPTENNIGQRTEVRGIGSVPTENNEGQRTEVRGIGSVSTENNIGPRPSAAANSLRSVWADLREGMAYLTGNRTTLGLLVCMTMASLGFATVNMIWIPYLQREYGVGAAGLGIADAALGAGMLVGGLLAGQVARRASKTVISAGGLAIDGLMYITILLLPSFSWIIAWQFVGGLALTPMQAALDTIQQMAVPDLKRGRVGASLNASYNAAGMLSMAFATLFGEAIGLRAIFLIVGIFVLGAGLLGFWLLKEPEKAALVDRLA